MVKIVWSSGYRMSRFWRVFRLRFYTPWNQHNCQEAIAKGKPFFQPQQPISRSWNPHRRCPNAGSKSFHILGPPTANSSRTRWCEVLAWPPDHQFPCESAQNHAFKKTKLNWSGHIYQNLSFIYFSFCLLLFTYSAFIVHLVLICISSTIQWVFIFHSLVIHRLLIYLTSIIHLHLIFICYSSIVHLQFICC